LDRYLVVLLGAGLGGLARYAAGSWIMARYGGRFPLGTFLINVTGSFLIGLLMTLFTERLAPHPNWRLFLVVGILGGYTTFSSFEYECYQALREGARWIGILYMTGSVAVGYLGVWLGALLAGRRG
jgi:fluoride exporter